ncbi:MAG: glycosyltransferase family 2 protein [Ignavibacteriae bacterium]|nr:glycosyltransferase family 2 protein [Ignavibacteriota bacterium]
MAEMRNTPTITIIIPTYQRPRLLKRALKSALDQTYSNIQICIYDNASGDETEEMVKDLMEKDHRIRYHCHPENIGMMANYQFAMAEVTTPFFSLLSDDDVLFPWYCETALKGFQQFPDAAFSAGSTIIMTEDGKVVRVPLDLWQREGYFSSPEGLLEMITKYPVPTCILFKREVIDAIPIDMNNILGWDVDYLIQIAIRFPFYVNSHPCGIFLQHSASFSNSQEMKNWISMYTKLIVRLQSTSNLLQETRELAISWINKDIKCVSAAYIRHYLMLRRLRDAQEAITIFRSQKGSWIVSSLMSILIKTCTYFPSTYKLLLWARKTKRTLRSALLGSFLFSRKKKGKKEDQHSGYEQYGQWLHIDI